MEPKFIFLYELEPKIYFLKKILNQYEREINFRIGTKNSPFRMNWN